MKRFFLLWFYLLLGPSFLWAGEAATVPETNAGTRLTWEECIRLAVVHNPSLESSRQGVLGSEAVKKGSYSTLYPQISASLSGERSFSEQLATGPGLVAGTDYSTEYRAQLSLQQTIFDGFKTKGNIDQARAELALAFANLGAQKALVSFELKSAYAQLLYAQELVGISQSVAKIRQDNARMVKLLYDGGREDKGAWLLSEANLKSALFDLDQSRRNRDVSERQLLTVIGKDLPGPVKAEGQLAIVTLPAQPDFNKLAVLTPGYYQQQARTDAASAGITLAQSDWYPTVSADVTAFRSGANPNPEDKQGVSGGITVSYPIFEGGRTYFNVKAARASLLQELATLRSTTNETGLALARDFKSYVDAADNVRVQETLMQATYMRYQIAEAKYRNGLATFQDFNSITDSYVNQQKFSLASRRDAVIGEATWEQSKGSGAIP
jgi:outer membrane protein TolC